MSDNWNYLLSLMEQKIKKCLDITNLNKLNKKDIKEIVDNKDWSKFSSRERTKTYFDEMPRDIIFELTQACSQLPREVYLLIIPTEKQYIYNIFTSDSQIDAMKKIILNDKSRKPLKIIFKKMENFRDDPETDKILNEINKNKNNLNKYFKENIDELSSYFIELSKDRKDVLSLRKIKLDTFFKRNKIDDFFD